MAAHLIYRPMMSDEEHAEQIREAVKLSLEILKQPLPDTFLGRKTQEPFPREREEGPERDICT